MGMVHGHDGSLAYDEDGMAQGTAPCSLRTHWHTIMKNTFLLALLLSCFSTRAADLLVAVGGGGAVHPTISSALIAAVDGDRILVVPGIYNENLVITKSLEIVSNSPSLRYRVNGNLSYSPASPNARTTTVISMVLSGNVTDNGASAPAGSTLRMIDCTVNSIFSIASNIRYVLFSDSVMSGTTLSKADVVDCYLRSGASTSPALTLSATTSATAFNLVVANEIVSQTGATIPLVQATALLPIRMENNILRLESNDALTIINTNLLPAATPGSFQNNSVIRTGTSAWKLVDCQEEDLNYQLDIRNNFSSAVNAPTITTNGAPLPQGYNVHVGNLTQVVIATGAPVPGSPAINAGDPDTAYTDLDLSRNDAGCYGGSFSRDNFDDPLPTTAVVLLVNVPRRTTSGAPALNITIDGFDR